jgi:spore coat protein A
MNRRHFFRLAAGSAGLLALRGRARAASPALTKFKHSLPGLGPTGANELGQYIPVANATTGQWYGQLADHFQIGMIEHYERMHSEFPQDTKLWGYVDQSVASNPHYLGPAIVAKTNRPAVVTYTNSLPAIHPLPVDTTLMGADGAVNRVSPHLHGGFVTWEYDGGPFAWFAPDGSHGESFVNNVFWYPNQQSARLMWYHDHALGITRLNAYAGLAAPYVLRDSFEESLISRGLIPDHTFEIPLVIQDKSFDTFGQLAYDSDYVESGAEYMPPAGGPPLPAISCVPEFFGDTTIINGTCFPKVSLKPAVYRFRILNGAQARFYNLNLFYANSDGTQADPRKPGPPFIQIGTEGGFLPVPVVLNSPPRLMAFGADGNASRYNLLLAPAERADILIDLRSVPSGSRLILHNERRHRSRPAILPAKAAQQVPTRGICCESMSAAQPRLDLIRLVAALAIRLAPAELIFPVRNASRRLTLNEDFDDFGRLIQRLGTDVSLRKNNEGLVTYARDYLAAPTEKPVLGAVERWQIFNLTGDTHPIHFHLVNVHVVSRRPFDLASFGGAIVFTGPPRGPDLNEMGWKETVRMNPGEVTTVDMKFDLPRVPYSVPFSPRLQSTYGINAYEYVWHCHILEHEEHDMLRPVALLPR